MDQCYNTLTLWRRFLVRRWTGEIIKPGYRNIPFARISARRGERRGGCATGSDWLLGSAVPGMSGCVGCVSGTICPDASSSGVCASRGVSEFSWKCGLASELRPPMACRRTALAQIGQLPACLAVHPHLQAPASRLLPLPFLLDSGTGAPCHPRPSLPMLRPRPPPRWSGHCCAAVAGRCRRWCRPCRRPTRTFLESALVSQAVEWVKASRARRKVLACERIPVRSMLQEPILPRDPPASLVGIVDGVGSSTTMTWVRIPGLAPLLRGYIKTGS